jgi:hypothetical protein
MKKQTQKNWIKRIFILIICSLILVITAPEIANYSANSLIAQDAAIKNATIQNSHTAYAATEPTPAAKAKTMERIDAVLEIQSFLSQAIWPVLYMIGGLMDNNLLFGAGMAQTLQDIWIPIRNLVNIFFVVALVGIALYNITGLGEDGGAYAIKAALPQIIIGIIAVNFSFLGIKVALDVVNVVSTAIFALPAQLDLGDVTLSPETQKEFCIGLSGYKKSDFATPAELETKDTATKLNEGAKNEYTKRMASMYGIKVVTDDTASSLLGKVDASSLTAEQKAKFKAEVAPDPDGKNTIGYHPICDGIKLAKKGNEYFGKLTQSNVAAAMAVNMMKIPFISNLDTTNLKTVDDVSKIAINVIFGLVMFILFSASFVALLIVLLARLVVMWISIALSPIIIVTMAVPALKEQLSAVSKISEQFTKHLFVPIPIAFALSIGWIMLRTVSKTNLQNVLVQGTDVSMGVPIVGLSTLQDLVVAVGCVAIIWMGVFEAAEGTIAGTVTGTMKGWLKSAGTLIGTLPFKHLPIIPIGAKGNKYSLGAVTHGLKTLTQNLDQPNTDLVDNPELAWLFKKNNVNAEDLGKETTAQGAVGVLKGEGSKKQFADGSDDMVKSLDRNNKLLVTTLRDSTVQKDKDLYKMLIDFKEDKNETTRKQKGVDINEYIRKNYSDVDAKKVEAPTPPPPGAAAAGTTAAAGAAAAVTTPEPAKTDLKTDHDFTEVTIKGKPYYMSETSDNLFNADGNASTDAVAPDDLKVAKATRDKAVAAKKAERSELVSHDKKNLGDIARPIDGPAPEADAAGDKGIIYVSEKTGEATLEFGQGGKTKVFRIGAEGATLVPVDAETDIKKITDDKTRKAVGERGKGGVVTIDSAAASAAKGKAQDTLTKVQKALKLNP